LPGTDGDPRTTLVVIFLAVNGLAGLATVLLLRAAAVRLGFPEGVALFVASALLFSHAFLNFAQTGSSYVPGLAFVMLALFLAVGTRAPSLRPKPPLTFSPSSPEAEPEGGRAASIAAGLALGTTVCFWFPYVLAAPGVLLAPLVLSGGRRASFWFSARAALAAGALLVLAYGAAMLSLGIGDAAGFRAWVAKSSHGVVTKGVARMVFGLARSFIFMGEDGVLFKRFLLKDPYNPVSLPDLVRVSLWKFLFFYAAMLALVANLMRSGSNRRLLALLLVGGLPVVVFGVFWQGGDMERYMPLYPFLFLALAGAVGEASRSNPSLPAPPPRSGEGGGSRG
jgi:hypothetical protein